MDTNDKRLIRQVRLANLLSFGPETPPLELENLNVLIGPNGSGKSNFIEALSVMRATPGDVREPFRKGGGVGEWIWKGAPDNSAEIDIVFSNPKGKKPLRHVLQFAEVSQRFGLEDERIEDDSPYPRKREPYWYYRFQHGHPRVNAIIPKEVTRRLIPLTDKDLFIPDQSILLQLRDPKAYPEISLLSDVYSKIRIYQIWTFGEDMPLRFPQKADMPRDYLMEDFSNLGLFLNRLSQKPLAKRAVIAGLRDLYDGIEDFGVKVEAGTVQVFLTEGNFIIPATRLSDGTLRYLCLLAILCDPEPPPLICIEEPELGLHPDILPSLADHLVAASERTQLIVTTHSDILVDAMTERPETVIVCEKHDGKTEMQRLDPERLKVWLVKYRLGQLWIDGEIGGKRW
ncbi:MAG TPA: AAA family ATPase [Desulfosporosinus sp.]|nr:AAA family ATPase [Desulfosporosinus sp.]